MTESKESDASLAAERIVQWLEDESFARQHDVIYGEIAARIRQRFVSKNVSQDKDVKIRDLLDRAFYLVDPLALSHLTQGTDWRKDAEQWIRDTLPVLHGREEKVDESCDASEPRDAGKLRIVRGDCFDLARSMRGEVDLIIADPPYGDILSESWDVECYDRLSNLVSELLVPSGTAYIWGGIGRKNKRHFFRWLSKVESETDLRIHNVITWRKRRAYGKKDDYLFIREECAMLVKGDKPRVFNIPLLEQKRGYAGYMKKYPAKSEYLRRGNVWDDVTELFRGKIHPAEKPSKLAEIMIRTSSNPGDLVVDLFAGSGSTGVAANLVGSRQCVLYEKSDCPMHVTDSESQ